MEEQVAFAEFQPSLFASLQKGDARVSEHPEREGKFVETTGAFTVTAAGITAAQSWGFFAKPDFPFSLFFCIRDMNKRLRDEKDAQQSQKRVSHNHSVLPHLPINYYLSEDLCSPWTPKIYPT